MDIEGAARLLRRSDESATPCQGLAMLIDPRSLDQGYAVQRVADERHRAAGRTAIGYKIGLTSPAVQAAYGANEPMLGILYADRLDTADTQIDMDRLCTPKLEGEIVLRIGTPPVPDAGDAGLIASIVSVHAAFEIADSRIAEWRIGIGEAIADNACCGRFGFVEPGLPPDAIDMAGVAMTIVADGNGAPLSTGNGANCLGSPLASYRWLIGKLAAQGRSVAPGDLILTGALGPMVTMAPNMRYTVALAGLGTLSVRS